MEPLECDSDRDSPSKSSTTAPPPPGTDDETDEEKKYILDKIEQANRELQDQEAPDMSRRRRLHFKEKLVDLVVPPLQFEKDGNSGEAEGRNGQQESGRTGKSTEGGQGVKEGRVLVEKDGKFDLVSLNEVESQGLLPPIANNYSDYAHSSRRPQEQTGSSSKIHRSSSSASPRPCANSSHLQQGVDHHRAPRPPAQPRCRPSSAMHSQRNSQRNSSKQRVQSATGSPCQGTYTLSPQQKELLQRIQERKEKLAREAEQRKREEEEQRRQDNELAFKAWMMRKARAVSGGEKGPSSSGDGEDEFYGMTTRWQCYSVRDTSDPEESFRLWLQRKQEQQQKERQLVEMKRLEEDSGYLLRSREECERAFKLWLKRKQAEKRAEQQAARERSRRLVLEERRARRMRDLMCTVNETKPFRFSEQLAHRF
ncbi:Coiled-coil domain-containing protein 181 [Collichthys lucidus]|uniref:Coiled-coil domain-containing protein 181 n=1 Tax=Collichthys lucidus TaxID=240159 RepID=A0A4U5UK75_COLLU|nr:Coiled-coil domain-containing protein 181 [Collichthys lucidus]